ncbi:MAG TPA: hypothetical protein VF771_10170, partial [Longimicrobiaceae bacterium]
AGMAAMQFGFSIHAPDRNLVRVTALVAGALMLLLCLGLLFASEKKDPPPPEAGDVVLAEWTLAPDEWRAYSEQEAEEISASWATLLLAATGGLAALNLSGGRLNYAAAGAALLGIPGFVATRIAARLRRSRAPRAGGRVVVRRDTVDIDGTREIVRGRVSRLHSVSLRHDRPLPVLEVTTQRDARDNGKPTTRYYIFRVPIPRGREAEARLVVERLTRGVLEAGEDDGLETSVSRAAVEAR